MGGAASSSCRFLKSAVEKHRDQEELVEKSNFSCGGQSSGRFFFLFREEISLFPLLSLPPSLSSNLTSLPLVFLPPNLLLPAQLSEPRLHRGHQMQGSAAAAVLVAVPGHQKIPARRWWTSRRFGSVSCFRVVNRLANESDASMWRRATLTKHSG